MDPQMRNLAKRCSSCGHTFSSPEEKIRITEPISKMYKRKFEFDLRDFSSFKNNICGDCFDNQNKLNLLKNTLSESRNKIKNFMDCDPNIVVKTEIYDLTSPKKEGCEDNAPILIETDTEMTASTSSLPPMITVEQATVASPPITTLDISDSDITEIFPFETTASSPPLIATDKSGQTTVSQTTEQLETFEVKTESETTTCSTPNTFDGTEQSQIDHTEPLLIFPDNIVALESETPFVVEGEDSSADDSSEECDMEHECGIELQLNESFVINELPTNEPREHQDTIQDPTVYLKCHKCQSFVVKDLIHNHMALKHSPFVKVKPIYVEHVCRRCSSIFVTKSNMLKHFESKTTDQ